MTKKTVWIPIAVFLALIFGGMAWGILKKDRAYSDTENRYLASKPAFTWEGLFDGSFTKEYETYITDQFPKRDQWIGWKTRFEAAMGKQEIKNVWLAKDGYFIVNYPASDFESELAEKNIRSLAEAAAYYTEKLGEDHVRVLLSPTASQILTDKLPAFCGRYDQSLYLNRVQEALEEKNSSVWLDGEAILSPHKEEYIFYRTDHHWTTLGAFYAYKAWMESLGRQDREEAGLRVVAGDFLGTTWSKLHALGRPDSIAVYDTDTAVSLTHNLTEVTEGFYNWEALKTRDKYAVFLGGNDGLLLIRKTEKGGQETGESREAGETGGSGERVLLVVKDSFANCLIPYAADHYDRILVADLRYLNMSLQTLAKEYGVTDLLVLYHVQAFATDPSVFRIAK